MSACPTTALGRSECAQLLIDEMAGRGAEVTVSVMPPLIRNPYTTDGFRCPHGVTYWLEPTSEQIAQWAREGVR